MVRYYGSRSFSFIAGAILTVCIGWSLTAFAGTAPTSSTFDDDHITFAWGAAPNVHYLTPVLEIGAMIVEKSIVEQAAGESPSRADVLYASFAQPGQNWRFAVDSYRHIDPGRRLAI